MDGKEYKMGYVGLIDRDNTSNASHLESVDSAYGVSRQNPKTCNQRIDKQKNITSYSCSVLDNTRMLLLHKNGFPLDYMDQFLIASAEFISSVKAAKKEEGQMLLYHHNKPLYDKHIANLFRIAEQAYNIASIPIEENDAELLFFFCKDNSRTAYARIKDFFCSRCEAILSLSDEERTCYFGISGEILELEEAISEREKSIIRKNKEIKQLLYRSKREKNEIAEFIKGLIDSFEEDNQWLAEEIKDLEQKLNTKKTFYSTVWDKIRLYDPQQIG